MKVIPICPGAAMANCYLIEHEGHALIVDPCVTVAAILRAVELEGAVLEGILFPETEKCAADAAHFHLIPKAFPILYKIFLNSFKQ